MLNQGSLTQRLWKFNHFINVIPLEPEIKAGFERHGVGPLELESYQSLYHRCVDLYLITREARGEGMGGTDDLQASWDELRTRYRTHYPFATRLMPEHRDRRLFDLIGPRNNTLTSWCWQARHFYEHLKPLQFEAMARFGFTQETANEMISKISELERTAQDLQYKRYKMTIANRNRNIAFEEMAEIARDLILIGNVLENEIPYIFNLLTKPSRASKSNPNTPTSEPDEPNSDIPDDEEPTPPTTDPSQPISLSLQPEPAAQVSIKLAPPLNQSNDQFTDANGNPLNLKIQPIRSDIQLPAGVISRAA